MKRLIVCSDGTWSSPEQEDNGIPAPTNVFKIYNAIADRAGGVEQLKYYHPGVGSEGGVISRVLGGAIGVGVSKHIRSAYHWLGRNYEDGDEIYLFGFSRGAFTARSIGGFLGYGLLDLRTVNSADSWNRVRTAYDKGYRLAAKLPKTWARPHWRFFHPRGEAAPVRFIGVWDTVGALGVPDDLEIVNFLDDKTKWQFHDTELGEHVGTGRHAMALDEIRSSFTVTRWDGANQHRDAIEKWFPGVHSDVGGGYSTCELSNGALLWMMDESHSADLEFRKGIRATIVADPLGVMHNSFKGAFAKLRSRPRNIEAMTPKNKGHFHPGARERQRVSPIAYPTYHSTRILKVGESHSLDVYADTRWNYSGLYLPAGHSFEFSSTGEWQDSKDTCDWKGTQDDKLTAGDVARGIGSFLGHAESLFKMVTKNESTDFLGTKRVEGLNWFTLVGAITNDSSPAAGVKNDGSPLPHQYVELAAHTTKSSPLTIENPGYLYCFPNDVWTLYGNNHGSVKLTIRRVS